MLSSEAAAVIHRLRGDALAVVTMTTIFTFPESAGDELAIRCAPLMGGASSIGLGLALARPERKVLVLDGDGSLLMQLGSLATIAASGVTNLYHFVFQNGVLYEGGGRVSTTAPAIDFPAMALAAGYATAESFDSSVDLRERLPAILSREGPVLVRLGIDIPKTPRWSNDNPQGEMPDWWFRQLRDDAERMARALASR
jgi:TPP-dependent trihydroxycyclohexane-1,2-dione (THcHDO) dehydratase